MKKIKIDHELARLIRGGSTRNIWQIFNKHDLQVNDLVVFIDTSMSPSSSASKVGPFVVTLIIEKPLDRIESNDFYNGKPVGSGCQLIKSLQKQYGPQVDERTPVKIVFFEDIAPRSDERRLGQKRELPNDVAITTNIKEAKLYADGGSRGNPGPSASGYVIATTEGQILIKKGIYLGVTTNNQAEYQALKFGLEKALDVGITTIHVYMDSLLVINQMLGVFKVKNRDLWPIHDVIVKLAQRFSHISFTHVPRELNKDADHAVNEALDQAEHSSS